MERLLFECDICRKQKIANTPPANWNEITYSWATDRDGSNRRAISYHACSPACYFAVLQRCVEQAGQHMAVEVSGMTLDFTKRLLEYGAGKSIVVKEEVVEAHEIAEEEEQVPVYTKPKKTIVQTVVLGKRALNNLRKEQQVKLTPPLPVQSETGKKERRRNGNWVKVVNEDTGSFYYRKATKAEKEAYLLANPVVEKPPKPERKPGEKRPYNRTGKYAGKTTTNPAESKNDIRQFRDMEVGSRPINIHAAKPEEESAIPELKLVVEEVVPTTERKMWLEIMMSDYKSEAAMEQMKDVWGMDRRIYQTSGLLNYMEVPSAPYLRYEDKYVCFVPKAKHYLFQQKIKEYLPTAEPASV